MTTIRTEIRLRVKGKSSRRINLEIEKPGYSLNFKVFIRHHTDTICTLLNKCSIRVTLWLSNDISHFAKDLNACFNDTDGIDVTPMTPLFFFPIYSEDSI